MLVLKSFTPVYRDAELFARWVELAAFMPVFRTHEGAYPPGNVQHDSAPHVLAHFALMAAVHRAWAPLRRELVAEAAVTGAPIMRHLFIHFPDDQVAAGIETQFMLGPDMLVAPVLQPCFAALRGGGCRHRVYLPAGCWTPLAWRAAPAAPQTTCRASGEWVMIDAPLGAPPVFYSGKSVHGARLQVAVAKELRERCAAGATADAAFACAHAGIAAQPPPRGEL